MRHRYIVTCAVATIGILVVGALSVFSRDEPKVEPGFSQTDESRVPAKPTQSADSDWAPRISLSPHATDARHTAEALPPESIATAHAAAVRKALAGDLLTACEQASELNRCALRAQALSAAAQTQEAMRVGGTSTDDRAISTVARLLEAGERTADKCAGVTPDMLSDAYELQKLASRRSVKFARWLATNPALDQTNFVQDAERWTEYRRYARRYFEGALRDRRLEDLPALLLVYYPEEILLPRPPFRSADSEKFLGLFEVAQQYGMALPPIMVETADHLKSKNIVPDRTLTASWGGEAPPNIDRGLSRSMFPDATESFCAQE